MSKQEAVYRVQFINHGEHYDLYVREVTQGALWGFVELADFVWPQQRSVLIDTAEEKLKSEFAGVSRSFIPMHNVLRIDRVERVGQPKVAAVSDTPAAKVTTFPGPVFGPKNP